MGHGPLLPDPADRPHPPILIGGSGEGKTLRLAAQYADACNLFDVPNSQFRDEATFEAVVAILPEVHAIEPKTT